MKTDGTFQAEKGDFWAVWVKFQGEINTII